MPKRPRRSARRRRRRPRRARRLPDSPALRRRRSSNTRRDDTAMAIINTFEKCLESPYLLEDKEAPARIGELLAKAGDRLEASVNIQTTGQGDPADVVFLGYEAMFCCLRALVYAKGYREYGLRCLLLACENLY